MTQRRIFLVPLLGAASVEREVEHWEAVHAPLFARTPGLLGYVQLRPLPEERDRGFHLVCSTTAFADREAERAAYSGGFYREEVAPDEASFLRRDAAWSARLGERSRLIPDQYAVLRLEGGRPGPGWETLGLSRDLPDGDRAIHVLQTPDREAALEQSRRATLAAFACRPVPVPLPLRSDAR